MAGENLSESTRVVITISEWKRKIEAGEITPLNATNYKIVPDPDGEDYGVDTSVAERLTTMDLYNLVSKKANAKNGEAGLRLETVFDNPITEVPIVGTGNVTVTSDSTGKILVASSGDSDSHTDDPDQIRTAMPMNLYKMSTSSHGHVHEVEAVTLGDGITMDNTNKIKHTNAIEPGVAQGSASATLGNGGSFQIPAVRYDAQGHIIDKGTTTMTLPTYSANNGIQVTGGTLISHTNAISPSTAKGSDTFTADNGDSFDIPTVSYDAQGHVTGKGITTVTLPEFAASDGIKIDTDGLTFKHTNVIAAGTAEGTDTSTLGNGESFTTPTVSYDSQGHVTGKGTHTITLPTFAADDGIKIDTDGLTFKHTNAVTPDTASGSATFTAENGDSFDIPTVTYDAQGHVTTKGTTTVTLPTFAADDGIKIGNDGLTFKHTNNITPDTASGSDTFTADNGDSFDIPTVTYDKHGHVTGKGTTTVTLPTFAAGDGIKIDTDGLTFKHTNAVTPDTASGSATFTAENGDSFNIPTVNYDAQGHVTGKGTTTVTLPTFAADDGIKIDTDGLTFKHTNNVTPDTASGSATFTADNGDSFDIPTVSYDKHGHVTAKGITTVTLPTFAADDGIKIDTDGLTFKHTNNVTPGTAKGSEGVTIENGGTIDLPTVTWDKHGHVTGNASTTVTLPEYAATDGIEIDTDGLTFKHTNAVGTGTASGSATKTLANGGSFDIPTVTWDDQGHVTAHGKTTITNPTYAAGDGIKIDTDGLTFKHTNAVTAGTAQGTATSTLANGGSFTTPTVTYDAQGHVTAKGTNTITLPTYKAGAGVKIDTDGLTFKHTNAITPGTAQGTETSTIENGGSFTTPTVTWDAQGHVTGSGSNTITLPEYAAKDGIEIDEDGLTFKHTNAITAGTAAGSATKTLTNGASFNMPTVNYDAQGHITAKGTTTMTLPTFKAGDGVKIDTDGLTFKHTNAITAGTAQGTATSTLENGGSFTTPTITYDAQGHITTKGTNTITLPEYAADGGIEIGEDGLTFMHTNNVTAGTASGTATSTIGNGGSFNIPTISYDKHGHIVTKGTTTITTPTFGAGDGIKLDGLNFKHTNAITAGTASGTATSTLGNGGSFEIPTVTYDAQGHVTGKGTTKITLPTYTGSNGVTVSGTSITNSGVRSIATGTANGTISVNTNGTSANVAVKGLGSSAYMDTTDTYSSTGTTPTSGKAVAQAIGTVTALMGSNNGIATLDASGKIPSSQIPGSYDDVLNFDTVDDFPDTGEDGKIYVAKATNTQYRWGGESYIPIGSHLALGETASTAYRGDRGAVAYTHATDSARNTTAKSEALYAICITAHGHVGSSTAITAGTGISLASNKISHTNSITAGTASGSATATIGNGGSFSIPTVSYDAQGHVTGKGTTTITIPTYAANTGIKLNGLTFQHTNAVTAGTASGSATKTLTFGDTFTIPTISYDAQGHVTGKGTTTMTMPSGGSFTSDITLYTAGNGATPGITFQRGTLTDNYNDWKIWDEGGYIYFGQRGSSSTEFDKFIYFGNAGDIHATSLYGNGANITALNASNISSGTLSADRLATSGVTAGSYGPSADVSGTNGNSITVPYITVDNKGRITAASNKTYTSPTYAANNGIKLNGLTFQHTNAVTAGTASGSDTKTLTFGDTFTIPTVTYDAQGHITATGTTTITMPSLGTSATTAAKGNHTHGITLAADSGTSAITLNPSTKYKLTAGGQSIIFTTPVNSTYTVNNGTLTIQGNGTSLGTFTANQAGDSTINITPGNIGAATSGHTHDITLAADSGTSAITLSPSTKYKLTAGGQSIIFTTPTDHTYTVNNGTLTIQGNGTSLGTFTANQSGNSTINITPSNIGAATSGHTHDISIAASSGTSSISLAANTKYQITAGGKSYIFTTPADTNTWRPVGTGATDAAAGNHTHDISIATSTGTSQVTLAHGGKYQITAGGQSYIFTMPADNNTTYSAGIGLSLSGTTFKTKLKSETALTNDSAAATETAGRIYPVVLDKSGYLAVNVPWTDHTYTVNNGTLTIQGNGTSLGTFTANQSGASTINITPSNIGAAASSHTHDYLPLAGGALTGSVSLKETTSILLRPSSASYTAGIGYDTKGNECIGIWAKNTVTRLRWHAGVDMTTMTTGKMMDITPDFEISKASGAAIGYIAGKTILTSGNYTSTVTPASIGAAAASHGNHVPATQTANNAIFLRNDNTWQTVTPANIGAAAKSHNHDSAYAAKSHTHNYAGSASAGGPATNVVGTYSGNGGQLTPSAVGSATVRFVMMNNPKGLSGFPTYADCLLMDTYSGSDVPWSTGLGIVKQDAAPRMFLFNGAKGNTTTWKNINEVLTTSNYSSYAATSGHNHDSVYAAKSHGNHVPATQTANNAIFLRNDNTWATVTPANIGAAATSHNHDSAYAAKSHTHGISIATSTGTNQITLAANTKYAITAGGQSYIFTTPADNNTTYSANNGVGLSGTTFYNSGVRSIATGSSNGTISVNTNGTAADVAVKGLGSAAYTASTAYAAASHGHTEMTMRSQCTTTDAVNAFHYPGYVTACKVSNSTCGSYTDGMIVDIPWSDSYGHQIYIDDNSLTIGHRYMTQKTWSGWATLLDTNNWSSYAAPASHTHTVSQITDLPTISDSATNSTLVKRTANGYIFATYLNQSSGAETPTTSSYIIYANSDGYLRKSSLANIKSILGLGSAAYTASTAYATASHNHDTVYTHKFHYGGTGNTTKIKIKINSTIAWMLSFVVNLYQGYRATSVLVSGYQYGNSYWYSPRAVILGDSSNAAIKVYFGYDSANNLWVGFDGGDYTGVSISNVTNGYTQIDNFAGLFTISNVSSLTTLQSTVTAQPPSLNGHTHGIALAADSGTSAITLSPSTKYKLTAGGQSIIFTTPTDHTYTVNNGTLTIKGNGTSLGTFTANQSGASTINITPANIGAATSGHNHDSAYAAKSHGNHVPATQTANNAIFLRNDNTWQTVTPANIGAATSGHTHTISIAASTGTNQISLAANTKYAITAGGNSYVFTTPADNNTTYSAGTGISLSGTTFSNSGVRSIATGGSNGTISVNTNGTSANVAVKGLGSAAYTASTAYAAASHDHHSTAYGTQALRHLASGTAAATTTNCPSGAWYGYHS